MSAMVFFLILFMDPTAEDLEQEFLKNRSALVSGKLTLSGERETTKPKPDREKWVSTIWYMPGHFRCDKTIQKGQQAFRKIYCENCERPGHYVFFDDEYRAADSKVYPLQVQSLNLPQGATAIGSELKFDPRILGVSTMPFRHFHGVKLSALIGRTDRSDPQLKKIRWRDKDAYLVSYGLKKSRAKIQTTYVPEMGHSIVKCELDEGEKGDKKVIKQILESEPVTHGKTKTWFPRSMSIRYFLNGNQIESFSLQITEASFGVNIPSEVFALAGMEIPGDTAISNYPGATRRHYWDGKKMVEEKRKGRERHQDKAPETDAKWRTWFLPVSVCLAAAGILAFGAYYWRAWKNKNGAQV